MALAILPELVIKISYILLAKILLTNFLDVPLHDMRLIHHIAGCFYFDLIKGIMSSFVVLDCHRNDKSTHYKIPSRS